MSKLLDDSIVKRYNKLMFHLCLEYLTIGTDFTENPKVKNNWNLRDLVSEVQYQLDMYNDTNSTIYQDAHETWYEHHEELYKQWRRDIGRMQRFIDRYKDEALTMTCTESHCSKFD